MISKSWLGPTTNRNRSCVIVSMNNDGDSAGEAVKRRLWWGDEAPLSARWAHKPCCSTAITQTRPNDWDFGYWRSMSSRNGNSGPRSSELAWRKWLHSGNWKSEHHAETFSKSLWCWSTHPWHILGLSSHYHRTHCTMTIGFRLWTLSLLMTLRLNNAKTQWLNDM